MNLGIIGCGKMGSALVEGALRSGFMSAQQVWGYDAYPSAAAQFSQKNQTHLAESLSSLSQSCDTFLLATKPQQVRDVLKQLKVLLENRPSLVISIAAGIPIQVIEDALPAHVRVIRTMPNTPALVGQGASAYALGSRATSQDAETAKGLFSSVGLAVETPEALLDAVTGLSGSGPAYAFVMIEALADAGVAQGLARHEALQLAAQTLLGAATMVLQTELHPAALKDMVTSPGGTTIAGIAALEKNGIRHALHAAVQAATQRSQQLSTL